MVSFNHLFNRESIIIYKYIIMLGMTSYLGWDQDPGLRTGPDFSPTCFFLQIRTKTEPLMMCFSSPAAVRWVVVVVLCVFVCTDPRMDYRSWGRNWGGSSWESSSVLTHHTSLVLPGWGRVMKRKIKQMKAAFWLAAEPESSFLFWWTWWWGVCHMMKVTRPLLS